MNAIPMELAHDLRMPLQLIFSCARLLRLELDADASPAGAYAELLMDGVRQLEALLNGSLSAPDAPPRLAPVDLAACARALCRRCEPCAAQKGVTLRCTGNVAALAVITDEDRLCRILLNLLSNALRFTPAGGRVDVRLTALGDRAELSVADTGVGIPPERLPFVFLDGETTGGHGHGLAIAQRLARELGGTLRAESAPGKGATFTLRLPVGIEGNRE